MNIRLYVYKYEPSVRMYSRGAEKAWLRFIRWIGFGLLMGFIDQIYRINQPSAALHKIRICKKSALAVSLNSKLIQMSNTLRTEYWISITPCIPPL